MITISEYKQGRATINTRTQKECDNLMRFFDSEDIVWNGTKEKASSCDKFSKYKEETCFSLDRGYIVYSNCDNSSTYKIITPTELKEYVEFMAKQKEEKNYEIKKGTVEELVNEIKNNKEKYSFMFKKKEGTAKDKIPVGTICTINEPSINLTIGQAIDYMRESEENVIEYYDTSEKSKYKIKIIKGELYYLSFGKDWLELDFCLRDWTKIKKHIEPTTKTLKELIEAKETFEYKNN